MKEQKNRQQQHGQNRNNPVRHTVSNLDKIKEYEELVMITNYEFNY